MLLTLALVVGSSCWANCSHSVLHRLLGYLHVQVNICFYEMGDLQFLDTAVVRGKALLRSQPGGGRARLG